VIAAALGLLTGCGPRLCEEGYGLDAQGMCVPVVSGDQDPGGDRDTAQDGGDGDGADDGAGDDGAGDDGGDSVDSDPGGGADSGAGEAQAPSWTAEEVAAAVDRALSMGFQSPLDAAEAWRGIVDEGRDEGCPEGGGYSFIGSGSDCDTASGYHYSGLIEYTEASDGGAYQVKLSADGYALTPAGEVFSAAVEADLELGAGEPRSVLSIWSGSMQYPPADGWLGEGVSQLFWCSGEVSGGESWLECVGSYSLGNQGHLYFEDFTLESGCEGGTGLLKIREDTGWWYDLTLDCSSCGALRFDERVELGEVCVDLSALGDFREAVGSAP
jgi:hypothetical protein